MICPLSPEEAEQELALVHFPNWLLIALEEAVSCPGEELKLGHKCLRVVKAVRHPVGAVQERVGGQGRIASLQIGFHLDVGEREAVGSAWAVVENEGGE